MYSMGPYAFGEGFKDLELTDAEREKMLFHLNQIRKMVLVNSNQSLIVKKYLDVAINSLYAASEYRSREITKAIASAVHEIMILEEIFGDRND